MKRIQPWQDTFCLLAGTEVRRSTRPGERFSTTDDAPSRSATIRAGKALFPLLVSVVMRAFGLT